MGRTTTSSPAVVRSPQAPSVQLVEGQPQAPTTTPEVEKSSDELPPPTQPLEPKGFTDNKGVLCLPLNPNRRATILATARTGSKAILRHHAHLWAQNHCKGGLKTHFKSGSITTICFPLSFQATVVPEAISRLAVAGGLHDDLYTYPIGGLHDRECRRENSSRSAAAS